MIETEQEERRPAEEQPTAEPIDIFDFGATVRRQTAARHGYRHTDDNWQNKYVSGKPPPELAYFLK